MQLSTGQGHTEESQQTYTPRIRSVGLSEVVTVSGFPGEPKSKHKQLAASAAQQREESPSRCYRSELVLGFTAKLDFPIHQGSSGRKEGPVRVLCNVTQLEFQHAFSGQQDARFIILFCTVRAFTYQLVFLKPPPQ